MKEDLNDKSFDLRRFLMLSVRKIWMIIIGAVVGAVLFGGFAFIKQ